MPYFITFLEGVTTFISPCLLPLLPVFISYFAGGTNPEEECSPSAFINALGFMLGFTLIFAALGAFAGLAGVLFNKYQRWVDIVSGSAVVLFGLSYAGLFSLPFNGQVKAFTHKKRLTFGSAVLFGMVFSVGWTPCVGVFLGAALMLASQQGSVLKGMLLLLCYALGLGLPFLLSAVLIERLKRAAVFIKSHYRLINKISGLFLIAVGILMITGAMGRLLALLAML